MNLKDLIIKGPRPPQPMTRGERREAARAYLEQFVGSRGQLPVMVIAASTPEDTDGEQVAQALGWLSKKLSRASMIHGYRLMAAGRDVLRRAHLKGSEHA